MPSVKIVHGFLITFCFYDLPDDRELTELRTFTPVKEWDEAHRIAEMQQKRIEAGGTNIITTSIQSAKIHISEARKDSTSFSSTKSRK